MSLPKTLPKGLKGTQTNLVSKCPYLREITLDNLFMLIFPSTNFIKELPYRRIRTVMGNKINMEAIRKLVWTGGI